MGPIFFVGSSLVIRLRVAMTIPAIANIGIYVFQAEQDPVFCYLEALRVSLEGAIQILQPFLAASKGHLAGELDDVLDFDGSARLLRWGFATLAFPARVCGESQSS